MFKSRAFKSTALTAGAIASLALLAAGTAMAAAVYPPSVTALNQKEKKNGVSITYAYFPRKGTLAIYGSNARGQVGKTRLGQVAIDAGDHRNVKIALSQSPKRGTKLWAVVQQKNGSPFRNQGTPAEQSFKIL
jgi:hypothetical protein